MWNFLWIYFNYFKYICLMANSESCFKFCLFLIFSRISHFHYGLCGASVQLLVSKNIRMCTYASEAHQTCGFLRILCMKHNLTGLLSPLSCKLIYFIRYSMPCLCMVIYLVKFQIFFLIHFVQTSKVCRYLWLTFDVLEALSFATKQKNCQNIFNLCVYYYHRRW